MKKTLLLIAMMLCCAMTMFAQNNRISYQAVVRDTANRLVANKTVTVTVNIFNGDAQTAAYSETHTNVQTNYNGLFSLQIGNGNVTSGNWNAIDWKNAKVKTAVSLDGTQLATLNMPLTAVPYALYADYAEEINPDAVVVTNIYDKMRSDSLALGTLIDANTAEIGNLKIADANLSQRIVADSNNLVNFKAKMKTDSTTLRNLINTNAENIGKLQEMDEALSARITADSNNLVNFKAKMKTDSTTLRNLINTNAAEIGKLKIADAKLDQRIVADSNKLVALQNRVNTFNTNICDSVMACETIEHMRDSIQTNAAAIATKADAADVYTKTQIDENIDSVKVNIRTEIAAKADAADVYTKEQVYTKVEIDALLQNLPKMDQETFTVANDGQTTFTLTNAPKSNYIYRMYINGVMVGGSNTQVLTISSTATKTMQYDASKNGNYALKANDKVTIVYWY